MPVSRSRTAHPVGEESHRLTMGSLGTVLLLVVLTTFLAGIAAGGLYLHTGQPAWPPEPLTRPGSWPAVGGALLTLAGTAAVTFTTVRLRRDEQRIPVLLLLVAAATLAAAATILAIDLATVPFDWQDHAYASLYVVLTALAATFIAVGALMVGGIAIQLLVGIVDAQRMVEVDNVVLYLWWTVVAVPILLGIVHLLPDPGGVV